MGNQNESHIVEIEGKRFAFGKMPARTAFYMQIRLARVAGEGLIRMAAGAMAANGMTAQAFLAAIQQDPKAMSEGIGKLLQQADPETVMGIMDDLFDYVRVDGKPAGKDMFTPTFTGLSPAAPWKVLVGAIKENYGSFFPASPSPSSPGDPVIT